MPSYSQQLSRLAALFGGNQSSYGLPLANRNYFVDGNFDSFIATSAVVAANGSSNGVATMYYGIAGATNGGTLSIGSPLAIGTEPIGMTSPVGNVLTWAQASAPTTAPSITQRVESVQTLQGRAGTFSCWLWCASGTQTITNIEVLQHFGNGGSPSADVVTNVPVNWVLTTTPQRFSVLILVPGIAGKTLGTTAATHYLQVYLQYPASGTYTINTNQWQLEQSSPNAPAAGMPTAFEYRGQQAEAARVARYYQGVAASYTGYTTAGNGVGYLVNYPTPMRSAPGAVVSNQSYVNASAMSASSASTNSVQTGATATATGPAAYTGVVTLEARL